MPLMIVKHRLALLMLGMSLGGIKPNGNDILEPWTDEAGATQLAVAVADLSVGRSTLYYVILRVSFVNAFLEVVYSHELAMYTP